MLGQIDIFGKTKLEKTIERIKAFEPEDGYYLAFSGGKDSQCIYHLAKMAGVKFDAHYRVTSVDPPELVRFIKEQYPDVSREIPRDKDGKPITMWSLIASKTMPPTRVSRYCCQELKESGGDGRVTITGVRWAESKSRRDNQGIVTIQQKPKSTMKIADKEGADYRKSKSGGVILNLDNAEEKRTVEMCYRTRKTLMNPIIDWTDDEVWEFLNDIAKVPHCCLYDEGFKRIGCIGCPMASDKHREMEFERYPKYKQAYIRAMQKMVDNHPGQIRVATGELSEGGGTQLHKMGRVVFLWWTKQREAVIRENGLSGG